jgi:amidase
MRTAAEIARLVTTGELSAVQVVTETLALLDERAADAVVMVLREQALHDAARVDADPRGLRLAGVPVVIKDNVAVAGQPTRIGSLATSAEVAAHDAPLVARLRAAGAVVVATSSVPEQCVFGTTDGPGYTARNPWNPSRTPGGSSGGSAALVAAGVVPLGHGNDGMGSIRIPAACCGLVGIKPGRGVVPHGSASTWRGMAENGPLATTVEDCALGLSVMADAPQLADLVEPNGLRIAVSNRTPLAGVRASPHWRSAAQLASAALAGEGHLVRNASPAYPFWLGGVLVATWTGAVDDDLAGQDRRLLQRRTCTHAQVGRVLARTGLAGARWRSRWEDVATAFFESHDVLVTPSLARAPLQAARWSERGWLRNVGANAVYAPFAAPWNLLGWPAMSVPVPGSSSAGTPLGVQLVGAPGSEPILLGLAATLERVRPWTRTATL